MALELSTNRRVNILVFTAIAGLLVAAISLWYSTDKKAHINGGSLIASSQEYGVVFSMDKSLYRTDDDARVLNSASYEALGLRAPLADIAFSTDALYVIEASKHTVKKCSVALTECQEVGTIPGANSTLAMDIAITPDNKYYYVSNSSLHRIDKFTINGEHLYELEMGESLNYPNDIYAIDNTVIAVADSVNSRVIGIEDGNPKGRLDNSRIIWQLNVEKKMGKLGLDWPSALSFSENGRLWVNNQNLYFDKGEIVVYDAKNYSFLHHTPNENGEKVIVDYDSTVVPLNEGAEPRNFAAIKNFMVVGNFNPIEVLKIDDFSLGYGSFLDGILQQRFQLLSDNRQFWLEVERVSKYAIGLFVLILIYAAFLEIKEIKNTTDSEILNNSIEPGNETESDVERDEVDYSEVIEDNKEQPNFECQQKYFQEIHYIGISILSIISMIDIIGDATFHIRMLFFEVLALIPPIFAYKIATHLRAGLFDCITFQVTSYLTLASGLAAWSMYALSGSSNPDTAGHMHILFFPIIHSLSMGIWLFIGILVAVIYKSSIHYKS